MSDQFISKKPYSDLDATQTHQASFNDNTFSHLVDGFLSAIVGRKVSQTVTTTTVSGDTSVFTFSENGNQMLVITVVYTDGTQSTMLYAERTA